MKKEKIKRVCPVCGKVHDYPCKEGLCAKHYDQKYRYGKFLDSSPRSIYDPNEYRVEGDITYISVYDKRGVRYPQEVIIDTEDAVNILKYKVFIRYFKKGNCWYALCNVDRNCKEYVHKMLCNSTSTVDHINGNTLDNRKSNLRPANMTIQNLNKISARGIQKGSLGGYAATMGYNGKQYLSKYYKTEEEAMYYRYLLLQLLPFNTNYNLDFMSKLNEEQRISINKDFENRFKNRVL